jgi:ParB/RepB/Spo0J family partition protein
VSDTNDTTSAAEKKAPKVGGLAGRMVKKGENKKATAVLTSSEDGARRHQRPPKSEAENALSSDVSVADAGVNKNDSHESHRELEKNDSHESPLHAPSSSYGDRGFVERDIPLEKIRSWDFKDRTHRELESDEDYSDLVRRMAAVGQLQSIGVRRLAEPDGLIEYEEFFGFKRFNAARDLGRKTISARDYGVLTDLEAAVLQDSENKGKSLPSSWSRGENFKKYIAKGLVKSGSALADLFGEDRKYINNLVRVARDMPEELKDTLELHEFGMRTLLMLVSMTRAEAGASGETDAKAVSAIVARAKELNGEPESAKRVLDLIAKELAPLPQKTPTAVRTLRINGEAAVSWSRNNQGATIKVSDKIAKKLDDEQLEAVLEKLFSNLE